MTEIDRQLWEIDENLMRAELSVVERDDHLVRRKDLWQAREKTGGASCTTSLSDGRAAGPQHQKNFAAETAAATGISKSTINRATSHAKAIPADIRDQIKGTKLDTGVYLDSLKGMEPDEQRAKVRCDLAEPKRR